MSVGGRAHATIHDAVVGKGREWRGKLARKSVSVGARDGMMGDGEVHSVRVCCLPLPLSQATRLPSEQVRNVE